MSYFGGAIKKSEIYDVAVLGVPYDGKSSFLRGPAKGPQAIREAWTDEEQSAWTELRIDLEKALTMVDLGDLDVTGQFSEVSSRIESKVLSVVEKEAVPILLGGDHSISYPIVKAVAKKFGSLDLKCLKKRTFASVSESLFSPNMYGLKSSASFIPLAFNARRNFFPLFKA